MCQNILYDSVYFFVFEKFVDTRLGVRLHGLELSSVSLRQVGGLASEVIGLHDGGGLDSC